jgi:hypothetical protein
VREAGVPAGHARVHGFTCTYFDIARTKKGCQPKGGFGTRLNFWQALGCVDWRRQDSRAEAKEKDYQSLMT